ncbi:hypothetical protein ACFL96_06630 [Thermoproteota archaeon]
MEEERRPRDPIESFVKEMVESSKKPFDPPKANEANEKPEEIEELTGKIMDKVQRS